MKQRGSPAAVQLAGPWASFQSLKGKIEASVIFVFLAFFFSFLPRYRGWTLLTGELASIVSSQLFERNGIILIKYLKYPSAP